jgi:ATP-dependent Clp protease adaptor protein ClpS
MRTRPWAPSTVIVASPGAVDFVYGDTNGGRVRMSTAPTTTVDTDTLERLLPPWCVLLHNDDHNGMDHVVRSLLRCVPSLTVEEAAEIMLMAHLHGEATVISCPKEAAEHYRDGLESCGLTATIEPA